MKRDKGWRFSSTPPARDRTPPEGGQSKLEEEGERAGSLVAILGQQDG